MDIPLNNKNFQKIIKFYLFECPVRTVARIDKKQPKGGKRHREYKKVSKMGKTFKERGLDGPNLNTLRAAMKKVTKDLALVAIKDFIAESDIPCNNEYVVIRKNDESVSITEGYFYCIRNALAHGDFEIQGKYYFLKNAQGGKIKGVA